MEIEQIVTSRISRLWHHSIVQNAIALYAAQFATFLLPLVTVPYLARVLGPDIWGLVVFAQAFGLYAMLIVDYGFLLSATRDVARHRDSAERLSEILSGVLGAKLLLAFLCICLAGLAQIFVPALHGKGMFLWMGIFWGIGLALNPLWFFLGLERVRLVTAINLAVQTLATVAIFALVRSPEDGWKVLGLQGIGSCLSALICLGLAYRREARFRLPTVRAAWETLRSSWRLFLYRTAIGLYATTNTLVLGFLAPVQFVAFYAGADKIIKPFLRLMDPITAVLNPRANNLAYTAQSEAARLARRGTLGMFAGGLAAALVVFLLAPPLVRLALGPGFQSAVPALRVLSILLPVLGISIPLSQQWMVPLGLDNLLTRITISAAPIHLVLAVILGSRFAELGVAWALVATETYIVLAIWVVLHQRRLNPFTYPAAIRGVDVPQLEGSRDAD